MSETTTSIIIGTAGLTLAFLVSLFFAHRGPVLAREHALRIRSIAAASIAAQALHFSEEFSHQFYVRFPEILGLAPWPVAFFVVFNLTWLAAWAAAVVAIPMFPRPSAVALWFLALASIANGIVHPLVSLVGRGYFPGLWTSALVGIFGVVLLRRLASAAEPSR